MTKLVTIQGAHCGDCGHESWGFNVNIGQDGAPIWDAFYSDEPFMTLPYPLTVPIEAVAAVEGVYDCEACGGRVLVAMDAVTI